MTASNGRYYLHEFLLNGPDDALDFQRAQQLRMNSCNLVEYYRSAKVGMDCRVLFVRSSQARQLGRNTPQKVTLHTKMKANARFHGRHLIMGPCHWIEFCCLSRSVRLGK